MYEHSVNSGLIFKAGNTKTNMESLSGASWPVDAPASQECGRLPYNSLCNAESLLNAVFIQHLLLCVLSEVLTKQELCFVTALEQRWNESVGNGVKFWYVLNVLVLVITN